jgi:hypothetical protein
MLRKYLLMGTKLCPRTGTNEMDKTKMRELRSKLEGGRMRHGQRGGRAERGCDRAGGKRKTTSDDK